MRLASPAARRIASRKSVGERSMTSTVATAAVAAATNCSRVEGGADTVSFAAIAKDANNGPRGVLCVLSQNHAISAATHGHACGLPVGWSTYERGIRQLQSSRRSVRGSLEHR